MQTLCRDCGHRPPADAGACPSCGSVRSLRHAELHDLAIAHLDCDAFYATIEKRDRPELQDIPVIVGGRHRGVVSACCYIARTYGVHSAMPMTRALRACPEAVVIKPDTQYELQIRSRSAAGEGPPAFFKIRTDPAGGAGNVIPFPLH